MRKRLLVLASGTKDGGGSGFENLVLASRSGVLEADICGVVSNWEAGGVHTRAEKLGVPFTYFAGPYDEAGYATLMERYEPDFVALSGWLKPVMGLDPKTTFNIHPGPLPRFGGKKMYGHNVHEAVIEAYRSGEVGYSAVSMHFVTPVYDEGPVFFVYPVPVLPDDTAETLAARVQTAEHDWQPRVTNAVVSGQVTWDGKDPKSLATVFSIPRDTVFP